jgi:hypothetical protein
MELERSRPENQLLREKINLMLARPFEKSSESVDPSQPELPFDPTAARYCHHRSYYRTEGILQRCHGVQIPRNTLCHWDKVVADALEPPYKLIHRRLLASRKASCLDGLLGNYPGNLQTDAHAGYKSCTTGRDRIDLSSCWAHAWCEIHEVLKIVQRLAAGPIAIIVKLY